MQVIVYNYKYITVLSILFTISIPTTKKEKITMRNLEKINLVL